MIHSILPESLVLPQHTITGRGHVTSLITECRAFGHRGLLVYSRSQRANGAVERVLDAAPDDVDVTAVQHAGGEPTLRQLHDLLQLAREQEVEWVAGLGGGSVLDLAKACAGLLQAPLDPVDYHTGAQVEGAGVPFAAAPTTAGTGTEATINSVLINPDVHAKKSIRHPSFMARLVVLDAELLAGAPSHVIVHSGLDAFTQAVESFFSRHATWLSDQLSLKGVEDIARYLPAVYEGDTGEPADYLLAASYLTGVAFSFSRLGIVHGLVHPLGVRFGIPHGQLCAVCLPLAIEFNRDDVPQKYQVLSQAVGRDLLEHVNDWLRQFKVVSPLQGCDITDRDRIIDEVLASGSTAANPRPVTADDVGAFLDRLTT